MRPRLFALSFAAAAAAFAVAGVAHATAVAGAAQVDFGLYDIDQDVSGKFVNVGFLEVHDARLATGGSERHEHWYLGSGWNPTTAAIRFRYHQAPLGHGNLPAAAVGLPHYGFLVTKGNPNVEDPLPGGSSTAGCPDHQLCPVFHTLTDAGGTTVIGYANAWDAASPTPSQNQLFMLDPKKFVPPSASNCVSVWKIARAGSNLAPVTTEPDAARRIAAAAGFDYRQTLRDGGTAKEAGTNPITLGPAPSCPPLP